MKILNIHLKNINSLEGDNRVNFEQPPFSDTGVFAITGPNGSGKSSILDAITLGLYGETFRFDRPAEFVMTRHAAECFAEVEFALGQDKYKSSWHVQRAENNPGGEVQAAQMQLVRLSDGEVLASTAAQVCARITELTGMNFRNFTRSILLAQGDFAAFLNALDSERMDILEKIIGTDIYADYKQEVTEKAAAAQAGIDRLTQELAAIVLMPPEKREACQHDLLDHQAHYDELQQEQKALEQQQAALDKISVLESQIAGQEKQLADLEVQAKNTQDALTQIDAAQNALIFKDNIADIDSRERQVQHSKAELEALQTELLQLKSLLGDNPMVPDGLGDKDFAEQKQAIDDTRAQVNQLRSNRQSEAVLLQSLAVQQTEKKAQLDTVDLWLKEHTADETLLANFPETAKLKKLRLELAELTGQQKAFSKWLKSTTSALKDATSALEKTKAKTPELQHQLQADEAELAGLLKGYHAEKMTELKAEQQDRVKAFQELYDLGLAHKKLGDSGFGLLAVFRRKAEPEYDVDGLALELEKLTGEISREENIKRALDESVSREAMLKKMAADRAHLVDGKPCPLCGAVQHPFVKRPPVLTDSHQALLDQQLKLKTLSATAERLKQAMLTAQKNTEKNAHKRDQLQQIRSRWLGLCNRLNTASAELDINNLKLMQQLLDKETRELKNIVVLTVKYHSKKTAIAKLKDAIEKNRLAVEQWQAKVQQLDTDGEGRYQEHDNNEMALEQCLQQEQELAKKVMDQLAVLGEKMPAKGKEDAFFDRLNQRRQEYHGYVFRRNSLVEDLAALSVKQAACEAELARYDERLDVYSGRLQAEERLGLHLALIEKQRLIADKKQLLAQYEAELAQRYQALQQSMQTTQFTGVDELKTALALLENRDGIERQQAALVENIAAITAGLEHLQVLLDAERLEAIGVLSPTDFGLRLQAIAEQMELAKMEYHYLDKLLQDQQQLQQHYEDVLAAVLHQQERAEPCLAELAQVTAENGMDFRRRVQARWAARLLEQSNAMLEKISGRYYLRQAPSEQGLALEIEDTYQANTRRLPKTLSGGESFVVSLALALGLSELANNGKSVDSLFLDEGFGNLDADTLYSVISTLEGLQTHGKTVGVISHVDTVQKRFKAQLQIVKKPNGFGELRKAS
ncbi:MAG: AAA family ATPase [Methylovulum sp.]|nr:AAA family ATPase [Methylovulum sp.]